MEAQGIVQGQPKRSTFVTVVAWIFIVLAVFSTVIGILQNIMIYTMFPAEEMKDTFTHGPGAEQMPAMFKFMFAHMRVLFLGMLVLMAFTLVASIGLLKRMNWARISFIVLMSLGVAYNVIGVFWSFTISRDMGEFAGPGAPPEFQVMQTVVMVFSIIMALAFAVLFGWIIKKLVSKEIKTEFSV
jgi:hypothetical protein